MLRQLLVKPKDPVDKENAVEPVYKIKCEECKATYVGETERSQSQDLMNIGDPVPQPQRLQNIYTRINRSIHWNWIILKS